MKKFIALLLVCLQLTGMTVIVHGEEKPLPFYQETLLPLPEGYVFRGMDIEPGGSLLVLGKHTDGTYAFMRWQKAEGMPEISVLPDYGESLYAMQVAADGDIMLSTLPQKQSITEGIISGTIIWVNLSGEEIARFGIESDAVMPVIEALPGRRVAFASYLSPLDLLVYNDQGAVLYSVPQMTAQSLLFDEEILYVFCSGKIIELSADTGEKISSHPMAGRNFGYTDMEPNGEMYFTNTDGIYACNLTEGEAEKRMDSMGTYFGGTYAYVRDFMIFPGGTFAVAIGDYRILGLFEQEKPVDDSVFIAIYTPVERMINQAPFVITRMDDISSYVIQEAASIFQRRHPELDVQLRTFNTFKDNGILKEDAIRAAVTELLAVGGGDVIVLDYFPADSMKKRGMLRDIAHLVPKLSLAPGIAESLQYADGKVYAIPAQFSIPILMGDKETISGIQTFADILNAPIDSYQARIDCSDYTIKEILKMCMGDFVDDQGRVDFLSPDFVSFLEMLCQLRIEAEGLPTTGEVTMSAHIRFNLAAIEVSYTEFGAEEARFLPMPTTHGFSKKYMPQVELGIPTSAKNAELSEEFICLAISEEMGLDLNESFSTVPSLLDRLFEKKIKEYQEAGQYIKWGTRQFAVPSEEYLMGLHTLLCEVTEPLPNVDDQVIQFIMEELSALYEGTATAEQTAERINQRAFLFFNE